MRVPDAFDYEDALEQGVDAHRPVECRVCGATDVRWRQQGGKWVLFSLQPGVVHKCSAEALTKDFD